MSSEWPLVRLGDHVDACLGKMLDAKKNKGVPQRYLGNSNVRWGAFDLADLAEMKFEPHEEDRYSLRPGDLVVCEGGEPGRCAIWAGLVGMKVQKALHRLRSKGTLDNHYLFYWFRHADKTGLLEPYFTGTTIKHLTGRAVAALEVPLPPIEVQRAMVDVLRRLDDRITLLRETNATLEAIAQALFKSWFVDFDPVRAKMEGRVPEGMDEATAALFPDGFEESALGLVPKGWRLVPFGQLLCHTIGGDWGSDVLDDKNNARVAIIRGTDIPDLQSGANSRVPVRYTSQKKLATRQLEDGDIVLEVSGGSKDQPTGRSLYLTAGLLGQFDCPVEPASFCRLLRPNSKDIGVLLGQHLTYIYAQGKTWEYQNQSTGIANFQTTHFLKTELVAVPSDDVLVTFAEAIRPMIDRAHLTQIQELATLRDTLLPRLISGQLRLPEAEALLEEAYA
jgi:type I restriction enzyme S subunit